MSSINKHFTFNYSQPEEYRFSHDSVFLARLVFEHLKNENLSSLRGLDLCAGCGIIGLDFLFHCFHEAHKTMKSFDFVEVQEIYLPHFEKNKQHLSDLETPLNFKNINYAELSSPEYKETYDLILCNPPYFKVSQGKLSPSEFKNRCRFFIDSDFAKLITGIENCVTVHGRAFILLRDLSDHGFSYVKEAQELLSPQTKFEKWGHIRGTDLFFITKLPIATYGL